MWRRRPSTSSTRRALDRSRRRGCRSCGTGSRHGPRRARGRKREVAKREVAKREQTRARYPDAAGYATRDGVRVFWERYGDGPRTVLLLPTWQVVHSRIWKLQVPYLARHFRVVVFDARGSGRSDRPVGNEAYSTEQLAADGLAVMDATGTERAALVALSCAALTATIMASEQPHRVERIAYISPAVPLAPDHAERSLYDFEQVYDTDAGWAKYNRAFFLRDYEAFLRFFSRKCLTEAHCTKEIEDFIGWGHETDPATLGDTVGGLRLAGSRPFVDRVAEVSCPTLVLHGTQDAVRPHAQGAALADATNGELVTLEGSGHLPNVRDPVLVNRLLYEFLAAGARPPRRRAARRAPARARRRALYVSSPIGLGHARRDLAIARELRRLCPDLEVDWLAQHPVTEVLATAGERIHPASAQLASESGHISSEGDGHRLHAFQAIRRMDEILTANFMVFHDLVREEPYDIWIGDEAWELDRLLHENPELKTAAYVWLSDFVGWLPADPDSAYEAMVTADHNADMLEQVARFPRVRDHAIFIGEPDDIVPGDFGSGLPEIRGWTQRHFAFSGYVTDSVALSARQRELIRAELGYRPDERVCIVTVGGSGVGAALLRLVVESFPAARRLVPDLRMVVVAGPRIDPGSLPRSDGLEFRGHVPDLPRHLAVCDLAVIQGGLATAMELTAARRPFIYVPLEQHFEQNGHVRHRLERHRAGRRLEFADAGADALARAIAEEIVREVDYLPVPADGAARAAAIIAELL